MALTPYERQVQKEIETWRRSAPSLPYQVLSWAMGPVDRIVQQYIPPAFMEQVDHALAQVLTALHDASAWTHTESDVLEKAHKQGLPVQHIEELREQPLEHLDQLSGSMVTQNALMAAIEGGGAGLGGLALVAADIPLLFTINFRLIQQIGAAYGFPVRGSEYHTLTLTIFNAAASGSAAAREEALRECTVAAVTLEQEAGYRGRRTQRIFQEQNRHLPREIVKHLAGRKLGQMIPGVGAAIGAGINYWFTQQTAQTARMLFRALYIERKERI